MFVLPFEFERRWFLLLCHLQDGHLNLGTMLQVASRIASSFGVGAGLQKDDIRSTCINIHRRGIDFAFKV